MRPVKPVRKHSLKKSPTIAGASSPNCGDESGVQLSSMVYGP